MSSIRFALPVDMTAASRVIRRFADLVGRVFPRAVALTIGFIMTVLGLAMTATIVLLPMGIVVGLLGVALFVAGLFAPEVRSE